MLIPLKLVRDRQLQQQLFDQLRDLIASGRLLPGSRMPSSRMMAEQFAISRITVLLAYERLIAEGCLDTRPAKGTFVARPMADSVVRFRRGVAERSVPYEFPLAANTGQEIRVGGSDPSLFPAGRWRSLMRAGLDRLGTPAPEDPSGSPALREAIASWLSTSRGLAVAAEQVMLVKSRQQALHLAAQLASPPRPNGTAPVVVEDPCDPHAAATLSSGSRALLRVPVDADGLCTDHLPDGGAALIHVTPEHQRPLGVTLSHPRRLALLHWADRAGALVVEEDCEGELRYGDMHIPPLMSMDMAERVIMIGGFFVSLGPWLDMAYMVFPRRLVAAAQTARRRIDDSRGTLEQAALAEFLAGGGYARHLHRLTRIYASRRDALVAGLRCHVRGLGLIWGQQAGLHLAWFPPPELGAPEQLAECARLCGLEAVAPPDNKAGAMLMGFGTLPERQFEPRITRFAALTQGGCAAAAGSAV